MAAPWPEDGYEVLQDAAPADAVARYAAERDAARDWLLMRVPGDEHPSPAGPDGAGVVDPHAVVPAARDLLLGPAVAAALTQRLGAAPLLLDSAEATAGAPATSWHRAATFVALADDDAPLVVVVAALGAVELAVRPGSQRVATARFSGRYRAVNPERDGPDAVARHHDELAAAVEHLAPVTVALVAGDVALLHGDLVHEPVRGPALVGHASPEHVPPRWFAYRPERARRAAHGGAWLTSRFYDLDDAAPAAEAQAASDVDVDRVQDQLPSLGPPPRRSGGLVGTVRGLMGRRPPER
jgi:hypothetical protein